MLLAADFGDAPLPYPTIRLADGAEHEATGPMLGTGRDAEADGQPASAADGDDNSGLIDDEDGVTFEQVVVGQLNASVTVSVQGITSPSGVAKLDAWIDFNRDGSWDGPLERIANSVPVANGNNTIEFDVPSWSISGTTFARFRLSTTGGLGPRGIAIDGEVEDHAVTIQPPLAASGVFGPSQVITTEADEAGSVFAVDLDGDGDHDVLSASFYDDKIAWYENRLNEASADFGPQRVITTQADAARSVVAGDLDGDGDYDAVSVSFYDHKIAWYENRLNEAAADFGPQQVISTTAIRAWSVFVADVDGDGDTDVISASINDDKIAWYENRLNEVAANFGPPQVISTAADGPRAVSAADVDGDGDTDIVSVSFYDDKVAWYENRLNEASVDFGPQQVISTAVDGPRSLATADIDRDGDVDVLSASRNDNKIAWYENRLNEASADFGPQQIISDTAGLATDVLAADVDGDGDIDVLSAAYADDMIAWYPNNLNEAAANFGPPQVVSSSADGIRSAFAADMDGDGDIDVLSASQLDDKIAWYENLGLDFGDAPDPLYPTLLGSDGARHAVGVGPYLGAGVDPDVGGQPNATATGDDHGGVDDEDGVVFSSELLPGQTATVEVTASSEGKLDAWIDFNNDGSWSETVDQIFSAQLLSAGLNSLTFQVPEGAAVTATFARFRISSEGGLTFDGQASNGEVEDYRVVLGPLAPSAADLVHPSTAEPISIAILNRRRFIDVTFSDPGNGLDVTSITDDEAEFTLGGPAAAGVTVTGAGRHVDGNTFRYAFTGSFGEGVVDVDFLANRWRDNSQNDNLAERESFTVAGVEDYWIEPMQQVHANFTGQSGTVGRFGDSITITGAFFNPLSNTHQNATPEAQDALSWIQGYVQPHVWGWAGDGYGSSGGRTSDWPLEVDQDPTLRNIDLWLSNLNPEVAVIMFGTNDLYFGIAIETYVDNMREVIQTIKANGTVPILTSIPPSHAFESQAAEFSQSLRDLAIEQQIPLIDYYGEILVRNPGDTWDGSLIFDPLVGGENAVERLIGGDGVHPSNPLPFRKNFSDEALNKSGYTLRNNMTLFSMYEVFNQVFDPDVYRPSADLADPSPGSSISAGALNGRQYLDVTFADPGGSGLDPGSITDPGRRVHAERVGGGGRGGRGRGRAGQRQHVSLRVQRQLCGRPRPAGLRGGQLAGHRSEREPGRE